ncbi:low-density lipoprotein receptor-related protein 11 isoform X2 [Ascaphus truei]|uniref:low-density lipoprotein receptor-related protein 11 isoform X2 n=1 Tax=Ascaphus truei TaxID=8439 RepID=UPI003F5A22F2
MIYNFPAQQKPVWGVRPLISSLSLLCLLLCCAIGGCRRVSLGSPAPQLTDLRSQISGVEELLEEFRKQLQQQRHQQDLGEQGQQEQRLHQHPDQGQEAEEGWGSMHRHRPLQENEGQRDAMQKQPPEGTDEEEAMQKQLQDVGVRPGGDVVGDDLCKFNLLEDYIIRTKDSLESGATFLKAPGEVSSWKQCLEVCCSEPGCSAAVVERSGRGLSCYLFDCTHRGRNVCKFSLHRGYSSYTLSGRNATTGWAGGSPLQTLAGAADQENDKPPHSNAGQDVVLQLPVDWVILDGRESSDDHAIVRYEWSLFRGDPLVDMKVPQPGTLKLSRLQEGVYTLQLTVTDTSGQKSSDNVTVSVLPAERHGTVCTGVCSRYQFICDDGCCIDITFACDRVVQCPDGSDEAFCQNFSSDRKTVTRISDSTEHHADTGVMQDTGKNVHMENPRVPAAKQSHLTLDADKSNQSLTQELKDNRIIPGTASSKMDEDAEDTNQFLISKGIPLGSGHPVPERGAVLPLALGLAITALLLLMVVCRLQLVRKKLKKARPLTSEESDYLINGMYL